MLRDNPRTIQFLSLVIICVLFSCAFLNIRQMYSGYIPVLETNVLKLLPPMTESRKLNLAVDSYTEHLSNKIILVSGPTSETVRLSKIAEVLREELFGNPLFSEVDYQADPAMVRKVISELRSYPLTLLSESTISNVLGTPLVDLLQRKIYSPKASPFLDNLTDDPLLLLPDRLDTLGTLSGGVKISNGYLTTQTEMGTALITVITLRHSAFNRSYQGQVVDIIDRVADRIKALDPRISVSKSGIIFFASDSANRAESDIRYLSQISIVIVSLLFLIFLRSISAIVLLILTTVSSTICATIGVIALTPPLNLLTLGFGVSVIGISSDYTLHLLMAAKMRDQSRNSTELLKEVLPGLNIALLTSIASYLALLLSPFPGLQQLGLFTIFGLFSSYVLLILQAPLVFRYVPRDLSAKRNTTSLLSGLRSLPVSLSLVFITLILSLGLADLEINDDIRGLQPTSESVLKEELLVRRLLDNKDSGEILIVTGHTPQSVLELEEQIKGDLDGLIKNGAFSGYRAISSVLPSLKKQHLIQQSFSDVIDVNIAPLLKLFTNLGLSTENILNIRRYSSPDELLDLPDCLGSQICKPVKDLWIGQIGDSFFSAISLLGVKDRPLLSSLSATLPPQVSLISRQELISNSFKKFRHSALVITLYVYIAIAISLTFKYGLRVGLLVLLPTILGASGALGSLTYLGLSLSAFGAFGLIVLIGISIDYALFFVESKDGGESSFYAALVSALTTSTSFGILYLSQTPAIQSFGLVVGVGVSLSALLTPVVFRNSRNVQD